VVAFENLSLADKSACESEQNSSAEPHNPRVRFAGDWTDTGPSAMPGNESNEGEVSFHFEFISVQEVWVIGQRHICVQLLDVMTI